MAHIDLPEDGRYLRQLIEARYGGWSGHQYLARLAPTGEEFVSIHLGENLTAASVYDAMDDLRVRVMSEISRRFPSTDGTLYWRTYPDVTISGTPDGPILGVFMRLLVSSKPVQQAA